MTVRPALDKPKVCWQQMMRFYKRLRDSVVFVMFVLLASTSQAQSETISTSVSGVGHLGRMTGIPNFYVNGQWAGAVRGWGGGGGNVCCVSLKRTPNQPVMATVKWETCDISHIKFVNGRSVDPDAECKSSWHEQTVVVNFAEKDLQYLYVHFLPGLRVEVWSSLIAPFGAEYTGPSFPKGPAPDYAPLPSEKPNPQKEIKP